MQTAPGRSPLCGPKAGRVRRRPLGAPPAAPERGPAHRERDTDVPRGRNLETGLLAVQKPRGLGSTTRSPAGASRRGGDPPRSREALGEKGRRGYHWGWVGKRILLGASRSHAVHVAAVLRRPKDQRRVLAPCCCDHRAPALHTRSPKPPPALTEGPLTAGGDGCAPNG